MNPHVSPVHAQTPLLYYSLITELRAMGESSRPMIFSRFEQRIAGLNLLGRHHSRLIDEAIQFGISIDSMSVVSLFVILSLLFFYARLGRQRPRPSFVAPAKRLLDAMEERSRNMIFFRASNSRSQVSIF